MPTTPRTGVAFARDAEDRRCGSGGTPAITRTVDQEARRQSGNSIPVTSATERCRDGEERRLAQGLSPK
jgi:hypothetical protein